MSWEPPGGGVQRGTVHTEAATFLELFLLLTSFEPGLFLGLPVPQSFPGPAGRAVPTALSSETAVRPGRTVLAGSRGSRGPVSYLRLPVFTPSAGSLRVRKREVGWKAGEQSGGQRGSAQSHQPPAADVEGWVSWPCWMPSRLTPGWAWLEGSLAALGIKVS